MVKHRHEDSVGGAVADDVEQHGPVPLLTVWIRAGSSSDGVVQQHDDGVEAVHEVLGERNDSVGVFLGEDFDAAKPEQGDDRDARRERD